MSEKNLAQRLLIIGGAILASLWLLLEYRPGEGIGMRLRPGLDIAGGVSMIFEIDDTGMADDPTLADRMKTLLQRRVDPKGVYNLVWRVHGRNRLEIQMPLPPKAAALRRDEYEQSREALFAGNTMRRSDVIKAVQLQGTARSDAIQALSVGVPARLAALSKATERYDRLLEAQAKLADPASTQPASAPASEPTTQPAPPPPLPPTTEALRRNVLRATEDYESAIDDVLLTNLDPARFQAVLDLEDSEGRTKQLDEFKSQYPTLASKIDDVVVKHKSWRTNRGFLDGPADLQRLLRGAGVLEFRILAEQSADNMTRYDRLRQRLKELGPTPAPEDEDIWLRIDDPVAFFPNINSQAELRNFDYRKLPEVVEKRGNDYYVLARRDAEHGLLHNVGQRWQLKAARVDRDEHGRLCVNFMLDVLGGQLFETLTQANIGKPLCIIVDNVAYSAPNIRSKIGTNGQITGDFSFDKVSYLANTLQAGALPARLKETPISERTIGSSLGEANRDKAVRSGLMAAVVVLAIMAIYYFKLGLIANFGMMVNVLLTLAALAMLGARVTLDGIAGLILGVGMAVDANVLIYERMREEKDRGASLRMIVKNGFDKAFSTIFDSNVTTLLTCMILYYVGSEEVKGFGLTLGWGIALNLFTSVFITRTLITLGVKYGWIKDIRMQRLIGIPKIDWYGLRRIFLPASAAVILAGAALMFYRGADMLDVEFRGGLTADVELKAATLNDVQIAERLADAAGEIKRDARKLDGAAIEPVAGEPDVYNVRVEGVSADRVAALVAEPLEDKNMLQRGGVEFRTEGVVTLRVPDRVSQADLQKEIARLASADVGSADDIARANVNSVAEPGSNVQKGLIWSITTTETNRRLVQHALVAALGDNLRTRPRVRYDFRGDGERPYPVSADSLAAVIPGLSADADADVTDLRGGVAIRLENLNPPQTLASISDRLRNMRLQPGFQEMPWRQSQVFGTTPTGTSEEGQPLYSGVVVAVADPKLLYSDDPDRWYAQLAQPELRLVRETLDREQALRKVSQFKPQIAGQSSQNASMALLLSWAMIIAYLWVRFGKPSYGVAGVVALVHDVMVGLTAIALSSFLAKSGIGGLFLIEDFKINMPIIAAVLTIIGFSINDTIVIFDRIREIRGRLGVVTPAIINDSVNQCMSRTILTSATVLLVLFCMYLFGGSSIRGFSYAMLIGSLSGIYSTVAIAAPILLLRANVPGTNRGLAPAAA